MAEYAKCFGIVGIWAFAVAAGFFVVAFLIWWVLFFSLKKIKKRTLSGIIFLQELRFPILLILLEIAAIFSVKILQLPPKIESGANHAINVFIIITMGWFLAAMTKGFYRLFIKKKLPELTVNTARRTTLTQILFLYRLVMFLICTLTIGAVLLTFPYIKNVGVGILGSAGIAGLALGLAARPLLLNLIAGFQIAITKIINIGDMIVVEGEQARIEAIHLTRVTVRTWDLRRIIIPISYFIDKPFQNWDLVESALIASIILYCDYSVPLQALRKKVEELLQGNSKWNGKTWSVQVVDSDPQAIQVRISASVNDATASTELRHFLREKMIEFLQNEYPYALAGVRTRSGAVL